MLKSWDCFRRKSTLRPSATELKGCFKTAPPRRKRGTNVEKIGPSLNASGYETQF